MSGDNDFLDDLDPALHERLRSGYGEVRERRLRTTDIDSGFTRVTAPRRAFDRRWLIPIGVLAGAAAVIVAVVVANYNDDSIEVIPENDPTVATQPSIGVTEPEPISPVQPSTSSQPAEAPQPTSTQPVQAAGEPQGPAASEVESYESAEAAIGASHSTWTFHGNCFEVAASETTGNCSLPTGHPYGLVTQYLVTDVLTARDAQEIGPGEYGVPTDTAGIYSVGNLDGRFVVVGVGGGGLAVNVTPEGIVAEEDLGCCGPEQFRPPAAPIQPVGAIAPFGHEVWFGVLTAPCVGTLYRADLGAEPQTVDVVEVGPGTTPAVSPSGRYLAYRAPLGDLGGSCSEELVIHDVFTSRDRRIPGSKVGPLDSVTWQPDADVIVLADGTTFAVSD